MPEIIWSKSASKALKQTLEYWIEHNHSKYYSEKIASAVIAAEDLIKVNPNIGAKTNYRESRRVLILRNFSLFYTSDASKNIIKIIAFRDNHRKPKHL